MTSRHSAAKPAGRPPAAVARLPLPASPAPPAIPARRPIPALLALAAALVAAACDEDPIGSPLSIELAGPGAGVVGEEVAVQYQVRGRRLLGVVFTWGDSAADTLATEGAQSASGTRLHTYDSAGVYTVQARVEDAVEGAATAEASIRVEDAGS